MIRGIRMVSRRKREDLGTSGRASAFKPEGFLSTSVSQKSFQGLESLGILII